MPKLKSMATRWEQDQALDSPITGAATTGTIHLWVPEVALAICALAAIGCGLTTELPWFGVSVGGDFTSPNFSALSAALASPPFGSNSLKPGTQSWGFLILAGSLVLGGLAFVAALKCITSRKADTRGPMRLMLGIIVGAGGLISLVIAESTVKIPLGDGPPLQILTGSPFGLLLAIVTLISAGVGFVVKRYTWFVSA